MSFNILENKAELNPIATNEKQKQKQKQKKTSSHMGNNKMETERAIEDMVNERIGFNNNNLKKKTVSTPSSALLSSNPQCEHRQALQLCNCC